MILTVIQISFRRLLHNRVELLLTFVVPIAFFSIFALIFGGGLGRGTTPRIKVVAVDEAQSAVSRQAMTALREQNSLRFIREGTQAELTRNEAMDLVRSGNATMAIILRTDSSKLAAELMADASDQVASQVVSAVVNRAIMLSEAENQVSQLTEDDQDSEDGSGVAMVSGETAGESFGIEESLQPEVEIIDVMGEGKPTRLSVCMRPVVLSCFCCLALPAAVVYCSKKGKIRPLTDYCQHKCRWISCCLVNGFT